MHRALPGTADGLLEMHEDSRRQGTLEYVDS